MNWDEVKGNWNQAKGTLKNIWGNLTDDDIAAIEGDRDKLVGTIQSRYGVAREEAEKQVRNAFD